MVRYLNPGGYDFGSENLDGYGISNIVVGVAYSVVFYTACVALWLNRHHPIVKMRNVIVLLLSLLVLHVFCFMVMIVYTINGAFPCQVEFWCMNIYLPLGIGLFQIQNQQLLIVSRQQAELIVANEVYKPLLPKGGRGIGRPKYWLFRMKLWWRGVSKQGKYEAFVVLGIVVQFCVSFIIYNISRKFNHYGVVSEHTSPALCRRGWEWAPSVIWQFLWNFFFGPYLLWKIRMIRDIYRWRLQTTLAIIAGLPGTPLWLAAVYTKKFAKVNKYWIPQMWLVPSLMAMEIITLGFPLYQIYKHKRAARETTRALVDFDHKRFKSCDDSTVAASLSTRSTNSKRGKMHSMESLDECLASNHDGLQVYASCVELNGENVIFLTKVLKFETSCMQAFYVTCKSSSDFSRARTAMFRVGLSIFVSLVHSRTASYPVNIESNIYNRLDAIFGPATALVAIRTPSRSSSITTGASSSVTPWDYHASPDGAAPCGDEFSFPMHPIGSGGMSTPRYHKNSGNESSEHIMVSEANNDRLPEGLRGSDPLEGVKVPGDFDERVFEAAFKSVKYMVWTETWQRYVNWKRTSGESGA